MEKKESENEKSPSEGEGKVLEEPKEKTFAELGLDPRLVRALSKKNLEKPTGIQEAAIPLILEGKDVVARAKTGSGKTFAYPLPLLQKLFPESGASQNNQAPSAFILVPTRELCQQADLLLSYGYEDDLKALTSHVPKRCQCLLMSATSSADVEKLKKLVLHNPSILNLPELGDVKDDVIPNNVQQFYISCSNRDKFVYILALLKLELIQKKVLIFTNAIDMSYTLKLYLEQF